MHAYYSNQWINIKHANVNLSHFLCNQSEFWRQNTSMKLKSYMHYLKRKAVEKHLKVQKCIISKQKILWYMKWNFTANQSAWHQHISKFFKKLLQCWNKKKPFSNEIFQQTLSIPTKMVLYTENHHQIFMHLKRME